MCWNCLHLGHPTYHPLQLIRINQLVWVIHINWLTQFNGFLARQVTANKVRSSVASCWVTADIRTLTTARNHARRIRQDHLVVTAATPPHVLPLGNSSLTVGKLGQVSFEGLVNQIRLFPFGTGRVEAQTVQGVVISLRQDEGSLAGSGRRFRFGRQ